MGPAESDVLDPLLFDQDASDRQVPARDVEADETELDADGTADDAAELDTAAGDQPPGARSWKRWRIPAVFAGTGLVAVVAAVWSLTSGSPGPVPLTAAQLRQAAASAAAAGSDVLGDNRPGIGAPLAPTTTLPTVSTTAPPGPTATRAPALASPPSTSSAPRAATSGSTAPASGPAPAFAGVGGATVPPEVVQVATQIIAAVDNLAGGRIQIPTTDDNIALLAQWMANEGGLWADNPLNTSLDSGDYPHQFTSGGVDTGIPIFPSMADGVNATAKTLLSNPAYRRILIALSSGSTGCPSFANTVIHSPWASSHYHFDAAAFCGAAPDAALNPGNRHGGHHGAGHGTKGHVPAHKPGTGGHKPGAGAHKPAGRPGAAGITTTTAAPVTSTV